MKRQIWLARSFLLMVDILAAPGFLCGGEPTLGSLWADLADPDAGKAYRAIGVMATMPEKAVPYLKEKLQPAVGDRQEIDKLVRDLDAEPFRVREKAVKELERLADGAEESLWQALKKNPGLEKKRRIEALLARIPDEAGSPELVRQARALEALELAGTPEARELLQRLAKGNSSARFTRMAKASHERLAARPRPMAAVSAKEDMYGDPLPPGILARFGTTRMQNADYAALTPDSKMLVGVTNQALHVWDTATGRELQGFPKAKNWQHTRALAVSPDGKLLAIVHDFAASFDVYEFPSIKLLHQHRGKGEVPMQCRCAVAFSADSRIFVLANQAGIQSWDMGTGKKLHDHPLPKDHLGAVTVAPGGKLLATVPLLTGELRVWDTATGKLRHVLGKEEDWLMGAVFSHDATRLVVGGRLWDVATGKRIREFPVQADPGSSANTAWFAFSPDGATLAMADSVAKGSYKQRIVVWNLAEKDARPRVIEPPPGLGGVVEYSRDGKWLLYHQAGSCRRLDATNGKDRHDWPYRGGIAVACYSPDGSLIAAGGQDGIISIYHSASAKAIRTIVAQPAGVTALAFSPNGKTLVSCDSYGLYQPAMIWDVATGAKKAEIDNNRGELAGVRWAAFSPDSKTILTSGASVMHAEWEAATGKLQREFKIHGEAATEMAWSPDLRYCASGQLALVVSDITNGAQKLRRKLKGELRAAAFSADGRMLATMTSNDDGVVLWEMLTGRERARFPIKARYIICGRMAFSSDSRTLAWTGWYPGWMDGAQTDSFEVWDLPTRKQLAPSFGHLGAITDVSFSPDSSRLATASSDGTVLVRELRKK